MYCHSALALGLSNVIDPEQSPTAHWASPARRSLNQLTKKKQFIQFYFQCRPLVAPLNYRNETSVPYYSLSISIPPATCVVCRGKKKSAHTKHSDSWSSRTNCVSGTGTRANWSKGSQEWRRERNNRTGLVFSLTTPVWSGWGISWVTRFRPVWPRGDTISCHLCHICSSS